MALKPDLQKKLRRAVEHFWNTRDTQARRQGAKSGMRDAGTRTAVTGGRQMDGFISLIRDYLCDSGLAKAHVFTERRVELPGWYRPEKKWDLLVVADGIFLAVSISNRRWDRSETITTTAQKKRSEARPISGPPTGREHLSHQPVRGWAT